MFDYNTLPKVVIKEDSIGEIEVVKTSPRAFALYNRGLQWMVVDTHTNKEVKELYSSYDLAYGDVILTGLGFGILASWLCEKESVKSVTAIEISKDVIELFKKHNTLSKKLTIINEDANTFLTSTKYDCLFLDHYEHERFDWRIKNMKSISKNIPHEVFWAWSLEEMYARTMYDLNATQLNQTLLYFTPYEFQGLWSSFNSKVLEIPTVPNLTDTKINEYVYTYFDRLGYTPCGWGN